MITITKKEQPKPVGSSMYHGEGALLRVSSSVARPDLVGKLCFKSYPDCVTFLEKTSLYLGETAYGFVVYDNTQAIKDKTYFEKAEGVTVEIKN